MASSSFKPKAVVLGAGICGKTAAFLLSKTHDVTIFDTGMDNGLLKSKKYKDGTGQEVYVDYCAPHVFNSRDQEVRDFVFGLLPEEHWVHNERNAKIFIDNKIVGYPFEYNLWEFGAEFTSQCISELGNGLKEKNLYDFYLHHFGKTMCYKYHFPYNRKIWQHPLNLITTNWIKPNKVPVNTPEELRSINEKRGAHEKGMTHADFYYPKVGGIQALIDAIPVCQPIKVQKHYFWVIKEQNKVVVRNGWTDYEADVLISTIPVDAFCLYQNIEFPNLHWHGTDIIIARSDFFKRNLDISWIYIPEEKYFWHRMANVGKLQGIDTDLVTLEAPGGAYKGQPIELGSYHFDVVDYYSIDQTYPIETERSATIDVMIKKWKQDNIYSIGRWGSHNYNSNMDLTIRMAMDCVKEIRG